MLAYGAFTGIPMAKSDPTAKSDVGNEWPWWVNILNRFGFPVLALAVLCFAISWAAQFSADKIVVPLADSHISLVKSLQETTRTQAETSKTQADTLVKIERILEQNQYLLKEIAKSPR